MFLDIVAILSKFIMAAHMINIRLLLTSIFQLTNHDLDRVCSINLSFSRLGVQEL